VGFYGDHVLPRLMNFAMGRASLADERRKTLAGAGGAVLELGFGAGHNLPFYPPAVTSILAVDPSRASAKLARERIAAARFPVAYAALEGEAIDAPDASFDTVASTFTLCTVRDPAAALAQVRRVLRPGGKLLLVEHGRADDPKVRRWQHRLNGLQMALVGGCHLDRDIEATVRDAGFVFDEIEKYYSPDSPKVYGFLTRGVAHPR
jgi:ubiquinone/menaquinone biosynthesis C-methylase UbiE